MKSTCKLFIGKDETREKNVESRLEISADWDKNISLKFKNGCIFNFIQRKQMLKWYLKNIY